MQIRRKGSRKFLRRGQPFIGVGRRCFSFCRGTAAARSRDCAAGPSPHREALRPIFRSGVRVLLRPTRSFRVRPGSGAGTLSIWRDRGRTSGAAPGSARPPSARDRLPHPACSVRAARACR
ncbi:hypothetical protein RHECNPAF_1700042 [Rhizobium etli CNPAF512]|nr:hypothetical protein RHECNPAF_1700042 [Rhizobium etli CNPAF512]